MAFLDAPLFTAVLKVFDIAGVAIGAFAALRLQRCGGEGSKADRLLGLLILISAGNVAHGAIGFPGHEGVAVIMEPLLFLLPLGIVWYLRALRGLHTLVPMDAINLVIPAAFIAASFFPGLFDARLGNGTPILSLAMWLAMGLSSGLLMVPVARDVHRYRSELKAEYASLEGIDPGWLQFMLALMGVLFFLYALLAALMIHAPHGPALRPALASFTSAFTIVLSWASLGRRRFPGRSRREVDDVQGAGNGGVEPVEGLQERAAGLLSAIEVRKLYLDPELCLDDLAAATNMSRHQASEALNRGVGANFFDLVNGYRVEEFKRLCVDPGRRGEKIMTLALDAGFNSKPSFNLVFKKTTGMTPSQYRDSLEIGSRPIA